MVVGLITARGASKGIPNKNMVDLDGKPLLAYSFEVGSDCSELDRIFLSTDMPSAIDLAKGFPRIEVPFVRPKELCGDNTTQIKVTEHFLDHLESRECIRPDYLVLLQPTCPLRVAEEIDAAINLVKRDKIQSLIGVTTVMHHPGDYWYRDPDLKSRICPVMRSPKWEQRQDFPEIYFNTGALYICSYDYLRQNQKFYDKSSYLFEMAQETMFDIDSEFDLSVVRGFLKETCS